MAAQKDQKGTPAPPTIAPARSSGLCIAEGCKKSTELAEFCGQHFLWFKIGLITKNGSKAKDFEKKLSQINRSADKTL